MSDAGRCVGCGRDLPWAVPYAHSGRQSKTTRCLGCKQKRKAQQSRTAPKRRAEILAKMNGTR